MGRELTPEGAAINKGRCLSVYCKQNARSVPKYGQSKTARAWPCGCSRYSKSLSVVPIHRPHIVA
jgi:hypothetical protein